MEATFLSLQRFLYWLLILSADFSLSRYFFYWVRNKYFTFFLKKYFVIYLLWFGGLQNTYGSGDKAVALRVSGDRAAFYGCRILSYQDTLLDDTGSHYYSNCYIEGATDFICGSAASIFEVSLHIHTSPWQLYIYIMNLRVNDFVHAELPCAFNFQKQWINNSSTQRLTNSE